MNQINSALTLFFNLLVEAMPFLPLGVFFSSLLLLFVDERKLIAAMPKHSLLAAFFEPMVDLKNIGLLLTVFRGRAIVYLFLLAAQLTFLLTLLVNFYGG